ncbi:MAG: hypothetical protein J1F42_03505 [Lachnospiraceae bacterium]|nr:hypothetical protein [Lachnospiraceae bacterium]
MTEFLITGSIAIVAICSVVAIKVFTKDERHDVEIKAGKFHFSIRKHD